MELKTLHTCSNTLGVVIEKKKEPATCLGGHHLIIYRMRCSSKVVIILFKRITTDEWSLRVVRLQQC